MRRQTREVIDEVDSLAAEEQSQKQKLVHVSADYSEEQIRADVRRACFEYGQHGSFIPCITYGGPGCFHPERDAIIDDEIGKCSEEIFGLY